MTDLDLEHIQWVRALDVPVGAVLAVKVNRRITVEQAELIRARVEEAIPGRPVLVLAEDMELVVVRDEGSTNGTST